MKKKPQKKVQEQEQEFKTFSTHMPVKEVYIHTYTGRVQNVAVAIHIDYTNGTISIIDNATVDSPLMQAKKYVFAGRGLEYMMGWNDILNGMKSAINEAAIKLKKYQEVQESLKIFKEVLAKNGK